MDTSGKFTVIRGIVLVLGLALTGCLVFATYVLSTPQYQASASLLIMPSTSDVPEGNRFFYLGETSQARDVLIKVARSEAARESVIGEDEGVDYDVAPDYMTSAPLIQITGTGARPTSAIAVRDTVVDLVSTELAELQDRANVESTSRMEVFEVYSDTTASAPLQKRPLIAAAAVGLGLTLAMATTGVEFLARRLRRSDDFNRQEPLPAHLV